MRETDTGDFQLDYEVDGVPRVNVYKRCCYTVTGNRRIAVRLVSIIAVRTVPVGVRAGGVRRAIECHVDVQSPIYCSLQNITTITYRTIVFEML